MLKKTFRAALSLVLVFCLLLGTSANGLIAWAQGNEGALGSSGTLESDGSTINYVSLGDSMTNGYGLSGYDKSAGVEDYGNVAYPNQFAEWLAEHKNASVNHAQLAMSGIRTEDIHWLLELDYDNEEIIGFVEKAIDNEKTWDLVAEDWNETFGCGDFWTVSEIVNHGRNDAAYEAILVKLASAPAEKQAEYENLPGEGRAMQTAVIAKYFQESVADADIISLSVGNGNIGVFGFGRILEVIDFDKDNTYLNYNYADVLRECDPIMQEELLTLIDQIKSALLEKLPGLPEELLNVVLYIAVSLAVNYAGTVDAILQMNPDAEIILVPVMNTFAGEDKGEDFAGISLGDLMEVVVEPINKFIAALPAYMQVTNNEVYEDATFYCAESTEVECWVEVYGEKITDEESVIRNRFVESIVGDCACYDSDDQSWNCENCVVTIEVGGEEQQVSCKHGNYTNCRHTDGMVWGILGGMELIPGSGITVTRITLDEVKAYEELPDVASRIGYINQNTKAVSIAVYLAFEDAICNTANAAVSLNDIMGLNGLSPELFTPVMNDFMAKDCHDGYLTHVDAVLCNNASLERGTVECIVKMTDAGFKAYLSSLVGDKWVNFGHETIEDVLECENHPSKYGDLCVQLNALNDIRFAANMMCMLLALPTNLSEALQNTENGVTGLLALFGRCMLGNGLGGHPSEAGHEALYKAVRDAYETKHTAQDETIANLTVIIKDAYKQAYAKAKEDGKIDELVSYIDAAIEALDVAGEWVEANEPAADQADWDLWETIEAEIWNLKGDLEEIKRIIEEADDFDKAVEYVMGLEDNILVHYQNIQELAAELDILITPYITDLVDTVNYYVALVDSIANEAFQWIANGAEEFNAEYAELVEKMGALADEVDPALGSAVRKFMTECPADTLSILYRYGEEAALKLFVDAAAAAGDVYTAAAALAGLLADYGTEIYEAVMADPDCQALMAEIENLNKNLVALVEEAQTRPVTTALAYEEKINALKEQILDLSNKFYDAAVAAVAAADPIVGAALEDSMDALLEALGIVADYAEDYGAWLPGHIDAMAGELLNALLENVNELTDVAGPIIDAIISQIMADLNEFIEGVIAETEAQIRYQLSVLEAELKKLKEELINAGNELYDEIMAQIAVLEAKIAQIKALLESELTENIIRAGELLLELKDEILKLAAAAKDAALDAVANVLEAIAEDLAELNEIIKNVLGQKYEDFKAQLGELGNYLLNKLVEAAKKYAPELADEIYNYLYNNPEEVIAFFTEYGPYMLELAEEYGDEALALIGTVFYLYGEDIVDYVVENHEAILGALANWIEIHGENTAALIQVYAEALGLCDAVRDQIAELENALAELEKELNDKIAAIEKELADLYEQLENAAGELKAEIEAKIAALEAELAALKAALEAKIAEVKAAIAELEAALKAAIESGLTKIEALKDAIANLDDKVLELIEAAKKAAIEEINAAIEAIENAIANLDDALYELAGEIYEELKALLGNAANELLNKVMEAVKEYAPELADEIYNYLYNNPEEVIAFFTEYGPYMLELAEEYGDEALAVIGYVLYAYGEDIAELIIENHEAILGGIIAWAEVHGENTIALIQVYAEALGLCDLVRGEIAELEQKLAELEAELNEKLNELRNVLEAQLAELKAQLENALEEQRPAIEAAIAEIEKKIAELEALIAEIMEVIEEVKATISEMIEELETLIDALEELADALMMLVEDGVQAAASAVQAALDAVADAVTDLVGVISDAAAEELTKLIEEAKAALNEAYKNATFSDFHKFPDSYYVAIGDDTGISQSYVDLLAAQLGIDYKNLSTTGTIVNAPYVISQNLEEIAKADLITIGYGNAAMANAAVNALINAMLDGTTTEYDWAALVGEDIATYIIEELAKIEAQLIEQGLAIEVPGMLVTPADAMMMAIETYVYDLVVYALALPETVNAIREINPDALVVVVGMSNPFEGTVFSLAQFGIDLEMTVGEYFDYIVNAADIEGIAYAMLTENVIYVSAPDAESEIANQTIELSYRWFMDFNYGEVSFNPTEAGHEYIKDQIMNSLNVTEGLLGDVNNDGRVSSIDAMLTAQYAAKKDIEINEIVGDVNGDGRISSVDAMLIAQYAAKVIDEFPAEQ